MGIDFLTSFFLSKSRKSGEVLHLSFPEEHSYSWGGPKASAPSERFPAYCKIFGNVSTHSLATKSSKSSSKFGQPIQLCFIQIVALLLAVSKEVQWEDPLY